MGTEDKTRGKQEVMGKSRIYEVKETGILYADGIDRDRCKDRKTGDKSPETGLRRGQKANEFLGLVRQHWRNITKADTHIEGCSRDTKEII